MSDAVTFDVTLGPNVTFQDSAGATLLTAISNAAVTMNFVDPATPASGSGSVVGGVLELVFNVPKGQQGIQGLPGATNPATTTAIGGVIVGDGLGVDGTGKINTKTAVAALSGTALAFSTDGSTVAYTLTPTAAETLTLEGGVAGLMHEIILIVKQGATGYAVTLPTTNVTYIGTPEVNTAPDSVTALRYITVDGGASYIGSVY